jgi:hypothetical protein
MYIANTQPKDFKDKLGECSGLGHRLYFFVYITISWWQVLHPDNLTKMTPKMTVSHLTKNKNCQYYDDYYQMIFYFKINRSDVLPYSAPIGEIGSVYPSLIYCDNRLRQK